MTIDDLNGNGRKETVATNSNELDNAERIPWNRLILANMLMGNASSRSELFRRMLSPDRRRNINDECGFPDAIDAELYRGMYDREPVGARVVELMPLECWAMTPEVFENDDEEAELTPFEEAWDDMCRGLRGRSWYKGNKGNPVWSALKKIDILSGIGHFGVMLLGLDDGLELNMPVAGVEEMNSMPSEPKEDEEDEIEEPAIEREKDDEDDEEEKYKPARNDDPARRYVLNIDTEKIKGRRLMYLRSFDESNVQIVQYETNKTSPRFGQPVMYNVTFNDLDEDGFQGGIGLTMTTKDVHWTRIIHVTDSYHQSTSSEIFSPPRQKVVWNNLMNIQKVGHGSGEMYWQGALNGLSFETHPTLGGDVNLDLPRLRDMIEDRNNGLQRDLVTSGMSVKSVAPQVVDPTPQIEGQLNLICIKLGCPKRKFMGSEVGELASSQDDSTWNDRVAGRQNDYVTPQIIVPFVDRCIMIGVLPEPEEFKAVWPEVDTMGAVVKADVALKKTQAMQAYVQGGVEALVPPQDYFTKFHEMDADEVEAMLESGEEHALDLQQKDIDKQAQMIDEGLAPDPTKPLPGKPGDLSGKPPFGAKPASKPVFGKKPIGNYDPSQERDEEGKWAGDGGGAAGSHSIKLPSKPSKISIQTAGKALDEMGYKLGKSFFDLESKRTFYHVTHPNGKSAKMSTDAIKVLVYEGAK